MIARQAGHLARLVDDLLDLSRITRGRAVLHRQTMELMGLIRQTVEDHRTIFVEHDVQFGLETDLDEAWVDGDRTRLAQVLGNLLHNAAKFTPAGGRALVSVRRSANGGQVTIQVRDTGRGIAAEEIPNLFEAFAQADTSLDRRLGGLGLGLSIARGLVQMHGGEITAESEGSGKGATLTVTLPLVSPPERVQGDLSRHAEGQGRRVLVIEDNVDGATSLAELLELDGYEVHLAFTGREGIQKAHAVHPDVVLCDIGLPEMDGYGVARALRSDPAFAAVTLIALTGYTSAADAEKARHAGFDAHLSKPPMLDALEAAMRRAR